MQPKLERVFPVPSSSFFIRNRWFRLIASLTAREYEKKYLKNAALV
jgi:hypothetical protein